MPQTDARQEQDFGSAASYVILVRLFNLMGKMKIALSFLILIQKIVKILAFVSVIDLIYSNEL